MSDSVISKLSIEVEAQQSKLDRDLDQVERKAKSTGAKAEESLSLGGVASKLVGVFAALGTIEASFRGLTAITSVLDGDLEGALASLERMPFGIGPAIKAGRDFLATITGSREQAERLAAEWAKVAARISEAEALVKRLKAAQETEDETNFDSLNKQSQQINELNREYGKLITQLKATPEADPIPKDLAERLKDIVPDAKTAGEAIDELRRKTQEAFEVGMRSRGSIGEQVLDSGEQFNRQAVRENLQSLGTENNADLELKRIEAFYSMQDSLRKASNDVERAAIEDLHATRISLIEREEQARKDAIAQEMVAQERAWDEMLRKRKRDEERAAEMAAEAQAREAEQREKDRFVEGKGFAADEFMRTSFQGGDTTKPQEVKDPEALGALNEANSILDQIARNTKNMTATLA